MTATDWTEYLALNLSAAIAIALDACILVIIKFRSFDKISEALKWSSAIGLTHILFPMIGFVGGWVVLDKYPVAASGISGLGAALLVVLLYMIIQESLDEESEAENKKGGRSKFWGFVLEVLSVSYDALLSGPGKTVLLNRYPKNIAILSFFLVGALVGLFVLLAGICAYLLHRQWLKKRLTSIAGLAGAITLGICSEITLFSFFLVWCCADLLANMPGHYRRESTFMVTILIGMTVGLTLCGLIVRKIWEKQKVKVRAQLSWP